MRRSVILIAAVAVTAALVVLVLVVGLREPTVAGPPLDGPMESFVREDPPAPAPAATLETPDGEVALADFEGRVVLLNFWATWCGPCVEEMPALDTLQAELADRPFDVVAVSIDRGGAAEVRPFFEAHGIEALDIFLDPLGATPRAFEALGLPTTVLIDPEGRVVGRYAGAAPWDGPEARALIEHYMPDAPAPAPDA
ncbi:MAG: TlpA disulfide reductase family protein [Azospirillaceae bacterium]